MARAFLRNPELLILDEATSALDSESEWLVQEAIARFEQNHTVLVIAHRLSTVVNSDQILVMESGRIVERGTHSELLNYGQRYATLEKSGFVEPIKLQKAYTPMCLNLKSKFWC